MSKTSARGGKHQLGLFDNSGVRDLINRRPDPRIGLERGVVVSIGEDVLDERSSALVVRTPADEARG